MSGRRESSASSSASSLRISASPGDRAERALTAERALKLSERTVRVALRWWGPRHRRRPTSMARASQTV
eukprot:9842112-Lingulodinium_polyedra.AAC.1